METPIVRNHTALEFLLTKLGDEFYTAQVVFGEPEQIRTTEDHTDEPDETDLDLGMPYDLPTCQSWLNTWYITGPAADHVWPLVVWTTEHVYALAYDEDGQALFYIYPREPTEFFPHL